MKKILFILSSLAVAAIALISCVKEQEATIENDQNGVPFVIKAGTVDTKTANSGDQTTWVAGDKINLFHAVHDNDSYINDNAFTASADGASVSFSGTLASVPTTGNTYDWFAVYPYNAAFTSPDGTKTVTIPASQTQTGNDSRAHLAGTNCPLGGKLAEADYDETPSITMKNLTSVIKVVVTNKIASDITVSGVSITAPVNINGAFNLNLTGANPAWSGDGGSATSSLTVSGASALATDASAAYYIAVKPFTVTAGSAISVTVNTDQGDQTITTSASANWDFVANKIYTFNVDFTNKTVNLASFRYNDASWLDAQSITKPAKGAGTNIGSTTQTVAPISFTSTNGSTATRVWNTTDEGNYDLRIYNGATFTLTSTSGYIIKKIVLTGTSPDGSLSVNTGTYTQDVKTWTGFAQEVVFSVTATQYIGTINVSYQEATASDHVLTIPVKALAAAYDATSTNFDIRTLNVTDVVISSSSPGYSSSSIAGNTVTINHTANASSSPRDIEINVSSASAGVNETVTITQAGAPITISSLSTSSIGVTVTAKVTALTTKGFILTDDTGSILVYTNSDVTGTYTIGQRVTVAGDVTAYNKGLQFNSPTITPGAAESYVYPSPAVVYGLAEVTAFNADASNRLATFVQISGVVIKQSATVFNVIVGGGSTANATLYYAPSSFTTGLETGDYVTVKGYATSIMSSRMAVCVTEVTESDTAPALVFNDISDVAGAGVSGATHTLTPYRTSEATATILSKPAWVTSASINSPTCTTLTYTVSANGTTARSGEIVVRLTKNAVNYDYTIKISQNANVSGTEVTLNVGTYATANSWTNGTAYGSITIDPNISISVNLSGNNGKYYTANNSWRAYEGDSADITLTATGGKTLKSVTFTYASGNNGVIVYNTTNYATGSSISLSGTSAHFSVSHSTGTKNGNVQITAITVVYD